MAQSGPLAGSGKSALLAMKIWAEDQNAKGGLLGRPVELVYYDDQSNPANVPPIYTKLIDVDKVDLINSGYATPIIAAALPIAMQHDMVLMGLFGLANNAKLNYDKYFGVAPDRRGSGQRSRRSRSSTSPITLNPKPSTIAVITPDIQFGHAVLEGVRNAAQGARHEGRLRPHLPSEHDRLFDRRPRGAGDQSGPCRGRHPARPIDQCRARHRRGRAERSDDRRRR